MCVAMFVLGVVFLYWCLYRQVLSQAALLPVSRFDCDVVQTGAL